MGAAGSIETQLRTCQELANNKESEANDIERIAQAASGAAAGVKETLLAQQDNLEAAAKKDFLAASGDFPEIAKCLENECGLSSEEQRGALLEWYRHGKSSEYVACPADTSRVELTPDLLDLTEQLAENAHESWAQQRILQGWRWGKERHDENKLHPCLVKYSELSDEEREFDRVTAMNTLKLLVALGYEIKSPQCKASGNGANDN